jgi:hypothetical protein
MLQTNCVACRALMPNKVTQNKIALRIENGVLY